jgi:hypothetical protein
MNVKDVLTVKQVKELLNLIDENYHVMIAMGGGDVLPFKVAQLKPVLVVDDQNRNTVGDVCLLCCDNYHVRGKLLFADEAKELEQVLPKHGE